jgi:hypothetical protein
LAGRPNAAVSGQSVRRRYPPGLAVQASEQSAAVGGASKMKSRAFLAVFARRIAVIIASPPSLPMVVD